MTATTSHGESRAGSDQLDRDIELLREMLGGALSRLDGVDGFALFEELRATSTALRNANAAGGRERLAQRMAGLNV